MTKGISRSTLPRLNQYDSKFAQVSLNPQSFNALLNQQGIKCLHEKALPCPNYMGALSSQVHNPNCTLCENSMIHYDAKELVCYFSTNEMARNYLNGGFWEKGSALLTVPSYYANDPEDQVYISINDKFTLLDFEDRIYEVIHKADGNVDKLRFRAIKVEFVRTTNKIYYQNRHFEINENGDIRWLNNDRPGKDLETGFGEIFSISYLHRPIYRVIDMLHEGRYSQLTFKSTVRTPQRFPQQVLIRKDFIIDKRDADGNLISEPVRP